MVYRDNEGGEHAGLVVQTLEKPVTGSPAFVAMYQHFAKRILWMDGDVVPGAFQMNTAWYYRVPEQDPVFPEHAHEEDELIGFFGSDPENPYDLGAEIEIGLDGERRLLTRSSLVFIPGGMKHMPMRILKVDRPVFHFSIMMSSSYQGGVYDQ